MLVLQRELAGVSDRRRRRHAELAMQESERRNQLLLDSSRSAIAYVHEGMHVYANRAYVLLFGYSSEEDLSGIPLLDMIEADHLGRFKQKLKDFAADAAAEPFEVTSLKRDGSTLLAEMTLTHAAYDGEPCMQVLIQRRESPGNTAEIRQIRAEDPITGLLNRPAFLDRLEQAIVEGTADDGQRGGLLVLHLDDSARIRSAAGLAGTDAVLKELARALERVAPAAATLARLGDDTFSALVTGCSEEDLCRLGETYRSTIEDLLCSSGEKTIRITASVGMCLLDGRAESAQAALSDATRASSHVRERRRDGNGTYLFDPADFLVRRGDSDEEEEARATAILRLLSEGIKGNSLVLLFQPIIDLHGEGQEHYEVYLRLPDGKDGLLTPDEFIHLAEKAGMGGRVDRWVVLQSVRLLAARRSQGHDTRMTINLTHAALTDETFLPWLKVALKAAKLPREAVVLQITELTATTYLKQAKAFTEALHPLDCTMSVSRFGGSANPFGTLRHLKVEFVKLDGAFVRELAPSGEGRDTLRAMLKELETNHYRTVVPMVADAQILAQLFQAGVQYVQGHYFAEPSPEMDYEFGADS